MFVVINMTLVWFCNSYKSMTLLYRLHNITPALLPADAASRCMSPIETLDQQMDSLDLHISRLYQEVCWDTISPHALATSATWRPLSDATPGTTKGRMTKLKEALRVAQRPNQVTDTVKTHAASDSVL